MLNRLVLRLPLEFRRQNKLYNATQYCFCYIQAQKRIDMSKPAIKLMTEPLKLTFSLDTLKQAKLYGPSSVAKMFFMNNNNLSIGALSTAFIKGSYNVWQTSYVMDICLKKLISSFKLMDDSLQLHRDKLLVDFLTFIQMIQSHTHHSVTRSYLAFLAAYFIKNPQMKNEHKNMIAQFLLSRAYIFDQMLKYVTTIDIDDDKVLEEIIQLGNINKIKDYFENNACLLMAILNLQHLINKKQVKVNSVVIDQQKKDKLMNLYFKMLQNKQILPLLLNIDRMQFLFLNHLFQDKKCRDRFINIFSNIFSPFVYLCYRTSQNFQMDIFDRLYTSYSLQQKPSVVKVLTSYQQCAILTINNKTNRRINYGTLISLCYKHKHYSKTLTSIIIKKYIQYGVNVKDYHQTSNIGKEKIIHKTQSLLYLNHIITLFKIINLNNQLPIPKTLIDIFKKNVNNVFQNFNECAGINLILKQITIEQIRGNFQKKTNRYSKYLQFQVRKDQLQIIKQLTQEIQSKYKISCDQEILKRNSYLLNLIHHDGVRLKALFNVLNHHSEVMIGSNFLQNFYKKVTSSISLVNMIKKHISFPGLLQSVYLFYEFYFYLFKNNQGISLLQSLEPYRNKINKKIMQTIIQQKSYQKKNIKPQYMHNIEHLNTQIKVDPNFYSRISQQLGLDYNLIHQLNENKQIRDNFKTFLFSFAKTHQNKINLTFPYIQYPFYADFLIMTFDQRIAILIVPPIKKKISSTNEAEIPIEQAQSIERIFEQNDEKRQRKLKRFFVNSSQINYNYFKKKFKVILISCEDHIQKTKKILEQIVSK